MWNHGNVPNSAKLYTYKQAEAQKDILHKSCDELKLSLDLPNHSHLQYAKIEGKYAFDSKWCQCHREVKGTLDQLKAMYDTDNIAIKRIVEVEAAKKYNTVSTVDWVKVYNTVNIIRKNVQALDVEKSSEYDKSYIYKQLTELSDTLVQRSVGKPTK